MINIITAAMISVYTQRMEIAEITNQYTKASLTNYTYLPYRESRVQEGEEEEEVAVSRTATTKRKLDI